MQMTRQQSLANLAAVLATMPDLASDLDERVESYLEDDATDGTFDRVDAMVDLANLADDVAGSKYETPATRRQAKRDARRLVRCLAAVGFYRPITDAEIADEKRRTLATHRLALDVEYPRDDAGVRYTSDGKSFSTFLEDLK